MPNACFPRTRAIIARALILLPLVGFGLCTGRTTALAQDATSACTLVATGTPARECLSGRWKVTAVSKAPWVQVEPANKHLHEKEIIFDSGPIENSALAVCKDAQQALFVMERAGLFEGNLPGGGRDGNIEADLGLDKGGNGTPTIRFVCGNASYDFHVAGDGAVVFAYSNIIYRAVKIGR